MTVDDMLEDMGYDPETWRNNLRRKYEMCGENSIIYEIEMPFVDLALSYGLPPTKPSIIETTPWEGQRP